MSDAKLKSFRLTDTTLERIDALAKAMRPHKPLTRTDVLTNLVDQAWEAIDKQLAPKELKRKAK